MVIGKNTRRAAARREEEGLAIVRAYEKQEPPQNNHVPLIEHVSMGNQVQVVPPPMIDGEIREDFLNFSQAILQKLCCHF